jgi:hypothetical protein
MLGTIDPHPHLVNAMAHDQHQEGRPRPRWEGGVHDHGDPRAPIEWCVCDDSGPPSRRHGFDTSHVARMSPDLAPNGGFRWNELGSMESKSSRIDAGSAIFMLIREEG